jgi:hypothetical protein
MAAELLNAHLKLVLFQRPRLNLYNISGYKKLRTSIETENIQRISICHNIANYTDNGFTVYKKITLNIKQGRE